MPKLADEFLVTLAEGRFLIGPDQSTAVQEELGERRTGGGKQNRRGCYSNVQLEENDFISREKTDTNGPNVSGGSDLTSWTRLEELHSCSTSFQCFSSLSGL